jgi:SAM-dependent methyltransferase
MDTREVARYWESNAAAWTQLARRGRDVYRDYINTPAFFALLPGVAGCRGLDLGCGEGHNTRLLARRGAEMTALDLCPSFLRAAREEEVREPLGIRYLLGDAQRLPLAAAAFDFACAFMSLMDMPEPGVVLAELWRVIKPGGFLQFSISHPCTDTVRRRWVTGDDGERTGLEIDGYFDSPQGDVGHWCFGHATEAERESFGEFAIPRFHLTLSGWLNLLIDHGFRLERLAEPRADSEALARHPDLAWTRRVPFFLILRCRREVLTGAGETAACPAPGRGC